MAENTDQTVGTTVRTVADAAGIHLGVEDADHIDAYADAIDRVLAPLYPEVVHAYAHFTAEIP